MTNNSDRPTIYTVNTVGDGESVDVAGYPQHQLVVLAVNEEHTAMTLEQSREVLMALLVAMGNADADR